MTTLTKRDRDELLNLIDLTDEKMYGDGSDELTTVDLRSLQHHKEELVSNYYSGLPEIPISRCPYCGELATFTIDLFGLDGPHWNLLRKDIPPKACPHFFLLLGALNLNGLEPVGAAPTTTDEIQSGPEVPYVVPRLLELNGMKCVIYSADIIEDKFTAYFMTYFADPKPDSEVGHQPWLRNQYYYTDSEGNNFWNTRNDLWDFEIENWLEKNQKIIGWINPGDKDMGILWSPPSVCPYTNVQGRRKPLSIKQGKVRELPLPDSTPFNSDIFD